MDITAARAVSRTSAYLANRLGVSAHTEKLCATAGLVHAIGSADPEIASIMRGGGDLFETTGADGLGYNELSYAALTTAAGHKLLDVDDDSAKVIQQAVLWHNACAKHIEQVAAARLQPVLDVAAQLLVKRRIASNVPSSAVTTADIFAGPRQDPRDLVVRTCVLAAARIVSDTPHALVECIAQDGITPGICCSGAHALVNIEINKPLRLVGGTADQLVCAQHTGRRVTQVNAPSDFGLYHTIVLRVCHRRRRTVVVCPRNATADAVFDGIVSDLKENAVELSAELYTTGARQRIHGQCPDTEFGADIVVTNIDAFLAPTVRLGLRERAYLGMAADVILCDHHEYVAKDSAIYAACHNLIRARALCIPEAHTMCVSATPSVLLSEMDTAAVDYLPGRGVHFRSTHNAEIDVHTHPDASIADFPTSGSGVAVVLNAVRNVQYHFGRATGSKIIVHSKYTDTDRREHLDKLRRLFRPGGSADALAVTGPTLQASIDVEFREVHVSSGGAEADVQAAKTNSTLHLYDTADRGEYQAIQTRSSSDLQQLWFRHVAARFGACLTTTRDELYKVYSEYTAEHMLEIRTETDRWRVRSTELLRKLAPRRPTVATNVGRGKAKTGKPTLRNPNGSLFIIVAMTDGSGWLTADDALSVPAYEFRRLVDNEPWLRRESDRKFVLSCAGVLKAWRNETGRNAERVAADPTTPFPTVQWRYDPTVGLVRSTTGGIDIEDVA